jgi:hypothetical protein
VSLGTLSGQTLTRARLQAGAWGLWWVGCDLAEPEALAGAAALQLADQAFAGTIVSGAAVNGRAAYRMVGGAGGWGKILPKRSYNDDGGVRLSKVLGDAAREVGETLADVPATLLGPHYARPEAPAYELLNLLAPKNWYVDFAGVTHIGKRPATTYTGSAPRVRVDPQLGVIDLAVDSLAGLVPGVQVDGSQPATDVEFDLTPERLTARIYAGRRASATSRRLEAQAKILAALDPRARYRGTFEFRVVLPAGNRLHLQPVRVSSGLDDLAAVPVRFTPGVFPRMTPGATVMVAFADADPSRPYVFAGEERDAPGWMPIALELGDADLRPVARLGDMAGPYAILSTSTRILAGA